MPSSRCAQRTTPSALALGLTCVAQVTDALRDMSASAREKHLAALEAAVTGWRKGLTLVEMEQGTRLRPRREELVRSVDCSCLHTGILASHRRIHISSP